MKNKILEILKNETKAYASKFNLSFYEHFPAELSYSKELFFDHPLIIRCREDVLPFLHDEFGHGINHSKKVAIEAGALVLIEHFPNDVAYCRHLVLLAQLSGLMHDICRLEPDHAEKGADLAMKIIRDFPLSDEEKQAIYYAIKTHEAFKLLEPPSSAEAKLLSDVLYDADKFRWGPDNFTTTLWEICDYEEWPLEKIIERFPKGIEIIKSISDTFRTDTGQIYGPEFIEVGLQIGNFVYQKLVKLWEEKK
ncbi:hypothetical protein JCM12298_11360 [Desulfothermus naphthae]